jgi:serine/threonine protein kinase
LGSADLKDWPEFLKSKVFKEIVESEGGELNFSKNLYRYIKNKKNVDDDAIDLLENMLKLNPKKRFSAQECLNHKFFEDLDPEEDALPRI